MSLNIVIRWNGALGYNMFSWLILQQVYMLEIYTRYMGCYCISFNDQYTWLTGILMHLKCLGEMAECLVHQTPNDKPGHGFKSRVSQLADQIPYGWQWCLGSLSCKGVLISADRQNLRLQLYLDYLWHKAGIYLLGTWAGDGCNRSANGNTCICKTLWASFLASFGKE